MLIDSKEKRACNQVPTKIQTEAKNGTKAAKVTKEEKRVCNQVLIKILTETKKLIVTSYGTKAAKVTKIVPLYSILNFVISIGILYWSFYTCPLLFL